MWVSRPARPRHGRAAAAARRRSGSPHPPLEVPDVVRDLGDDVASQSESIVGGQVGGEATHQCMRVLVGGLLLVFDVAKHGSHHGLGLEEW